MKEMIEMTRREFDAVFRGIFSTNQLKGKKFQYAMKRTKEAIIKDFNERGLKALEPKPRPGRPNEFTEDDKAFIAETAKCPPDLLGCPFKRWSLEKLREYLVAEKIVPTISIETLRTILHEKKVKLRRTKTWKECNDPKLKSKKN